MADILDGLIAEGARELPRKAQPGRVIASSPVASESTFLRYAAWFDLVHCDRCSREYTTFDGLYEERKFIIGGMKHWLKCACVPTAMTEKVSYTRKHHVAYCAVCSGAFEFQKAEEFDVAASTHRPVLVPWGA
jgi:hypothetical protein